MAAGRARVKYVSGAPWVIVSLFLAMFYYEWDWLLKHVI